MAWRYEEINGTGIFKLIISTVVRYWEFGIFIWEFRVFFLFSLFFVVPHRVIQHLHENIVLSGIKFGALSLPLKLGGYLCPTPPPNLSSTFNKWNKIFFLKKEDRWSAASLLQNKFSLNTWKTYCYIDKILYLAPAFKAGRRGGMVFNSVLKQKVGRLK